MRLDHVTYFHNAIITEVPLLKECFLRKALGHKGTTFIFSQTHRYFWLRVNATVYKIDQRVKEVLGKYLQLFTNIKRQRLELSKEAQFELLLQ